MIAVARTPTILNLHVVADDPAQRLEPLQIRFHEVVTRIMPSLY